MKNKKTQLQAVAQILLDAADAEQQDTDEQFLTIAEACALAKVSRWTMARWIKNGDIRAVKLGKAKSSPVRIYAASLYAFLASLETPQGLRKEVQS